MLPTEVENTTRDLLLRDFESDFPYGRDQVLEALRNILIRLLIHDLHRLWNILYKIDVNEQKVKALFEQSDPSKIAPGLAELIYEREEQKARTRIEYRNK